MFKKYDPTVEIVVQFLRLLNVKVNKMTADEVLQNHPDWPSLLCINDSLNKWNLPSGVGKIDPFEIDNMPTPFLATIGDNASPIVIAASVTDENVLVYSANSKPTLEKKINFIKKWDGIYLIAEPHEQSGEPNYISSKRRYLWNLLTPYLALISLFILSFILIYNETSRVNSNLDYTQIVGIYFQYSLMLVGVFITANLLSYEINQKSAFFKRVCNSTSSSNCESILKSKQSKIFSWLSWSEVGFFYFTGGILNLILANESISVIMSILSWMSILSIPYTFFSIFYQWRVAKQWCKLCLAVQGLLLLGFINSLVNGFILQGININAHVILYVLLQYFLIITIWYTAKAFLVRLREINNIRRHYLRLKFNSEIFETILKNQRTISHLEQINVLGIDLGNLNSTNLLIKVCSTHCSPCSESHPKIEKLLRNNLDLKIKIIFISNPQSAKITAHLLSISQKDDKTKMIQALNDWYLPNHKNYDLFAAQYPLSEELYNQEEQIILMNEWCHQNSIHQTPTLFLNGYQLPTAYDIEDLEYLITEYSSAE
jgi:hypothetical protein